MNVEEYMRHDGAGLAALVKQRQVSKREVAEIALEVVDMLNPTVNAVLETWPEEIGAASDDLTAPFAGVPFLIKDILIQRAGRKVEMGSRLGVGNVAQANSYLMDLFDRAGFVTLGRTATPELGHGPTTESVLVGPTRNPWSLDRSSGGSSGGAGAAVAAGMVPIAHGNDGAGSIRIPAACCGLIGLKVSRGRVSSGPANAEGLFGMGVELALTRSIRDTAKVLDGLAQPMPGDPFVIRQAGAAYTDMLTRPVRPLRIAVTTTPWYDAPIDPEVVAAVEQTARLCREHGHEVEEASPQVDYPIMREACITMWAAGLSRWARQLAAVTGRSLNEDFLETGTLAMVRHGAGLSADDLLHAMEQANSVTRSVGRFFERFDCLLTPMTAKAAQPLGTFNQNAPVTSHEDWFDRKALFPPFAAVFNLAGLPAISLPVGMGEGGLPIGVQFAGRFGREEDLLALGLQLEQSCQWESRLMRQQQQLWDRVTGKVTGDAAV